MMAQVTAAALVSENKIAGAPGERRQHPDLGQPGGSRQHGDLRRARLGEMVDNAATVVGIELLAAAQGIDFHRPLRSSRPLEAVMKHLRAIVPRYERDRYLAPDIEAARTLVLSGVLRSLIDPAALAC